ncbi:GPW/gp25 family protein [Caulobacter sp. RL271]|uniref:GPW/gp25 family protein n=1 Tax=Caulobacter segnis TaxID=88688 RepID=A0ABY4ZYG8_9CAUL|nr:GPW/gp25 family protein [Caulobacter segnis]USQ97244.1 GPW/gp25 family protein [Caulobacter segnis]
MGLNRDTGRILSGWPHVVQSLGIVWSTRLNEREMRPWFGSELAGELGKPLTPAVALRVSQLVTVAIELWEPRFGVKRAAFTKIGAGGNLVLRIDGEYRPNGHLGDLTPEGVRTVTLGPSGVETA